jgi:hypothetical protein
MRKLAAGLALAGALVALAGCTGVSDAPTGAYKVGTSYEVTLGREWSDVSRLIGVQQKGVKVLSIDGPLLNRLYLSEGLSPGDALVQSHVKEKPTPTYKADFTPQETVEFVADSVAALEYDKVETSNLRPGKFGDADAVRFDLTAKTKDGLDVSGSAMTAQKSGKLYVILFLAPSEHYYGDVMPEVGIQPMKAPIPTALNKVTVIAATMTSG